MIWDIPIEATSVPVDEPGDRIVAFLIRQVIPTADVNIVTDEIGTWVIVDANADPSDALANYVSTPTMEERALVALKDVIRAIRTVPDTRTQAQRANDLEKGLVALAALVHFDTDY